MASETPSVHQTAILKQIAVDYTPDACHHSAETDEIHVVYDHRGGARWRSHHRFLYGTFGAKIKCPEGNTSGLNFNIYLSSLEGDKSQDEIDFEFLGKDKTIVQTNYYCVGAGGNEVIHDLGFDCSEDFHEYLIRWDRDFIEWLVDGVLIRREERREGEPLPEKPMFLYSSVWDASYIDEGRWTGSYVGCHAPYVCWYKDVRVPVETAIMETPSIHQTTILKQIAVDYTPDACHHSAETDEIHVVYDHRGGARWRSHHRFLYGTFGAKIKCPGGNTSGLNFNIYLSSLEGDKSQDEIDFEFLGKDKTIVQTNYYCVGAGGKEVIHDLGFDCSEDFHEYLIRWERDFIEWLVDGVLIRREERWEGKPLPEKPMFLYSSVWDASYIDEGRWTGPYVGCHAPYVCWYKDARVPVETAIIEEEEGEAEN